MERSKLYTLLFAAIVCITASASISFLAFGLKEKQDLNAEIDRKQKILIALGLKDEVENAKTPESFLDLYNQSILSVLVDSAGEIIEEKTAEGLVNSEKEFPVYVLVRSRQYQAVAVPVSGKGLWSTLYGYLALEKDLNTVRGITFYKHGETPGLGGEIEKDWFQTNFVGKKILDSQGNLESIQVIKGKVAQVVTDPEAKEHSVDGISGATITSRGVTTLLKNWLEIYEPFFRKARRKGLESAIKS